MKTKYIVFLIVVALGIAIINYQLLKICLKLTGGLWLACI